MKKQRIHKVVVTLRFDRPCTARHATKEARDCIHGEFFPYQADVDNDPGIFVVKAIKSLPKR